jgi:hypothetical protein
MTGTGCDHEHSEVVLQAAKWLADQPVGSVRPAVPALQQRFGISAREACETIALAGKMRGAASR